MYTFSPLPISVYIVEIKPSMNSLKFTGLLLDGVEMPYATKQCECHFGRCA